MYTGLSAALLRQATYTTARMGIMIFLSPVYAECDTYLVVFSQASPGLKAQADVLTRQTLVECRPHLVLVPPCKLCDNNWIIQWLNMDVSFTVSGMFCAGIFRSLSDALSHDGKPLPFHGKAFCGLVRRIEKRRNLVCLFLIFSCNYLQSLWYPLNMILFCKLNFGNWIHVPVTRVKLFTFCVNLAYPFITFAMIE